VSRRSGQTGRMKDDDAKKEMKAGLCKQKQASGSDPSFFSRSRPLCNFVEKADDRQINATTPRFMPVLRSD
jgi:hypothetical protein